MKHFILALAFTACMTGKAWAFQSETIAETKAEASSLSVPDTPALPDADDSAFGFVAGEGNPFGGGLNLDPVAAPEADAAFTYRLTPADSDITVKLFAMPPVQEVTSGVIGLQMTIPLNKP